MYLALKTATVPRSTKLQVTMMSRQHTNTSSDLILTPNRTTMPVKSCPPHCALGHVVLLASQSDSSMDALLSLEHEVLTVFRVVESSTGAGVAIKEAEIPTHKLVITLYPGRFDMFSFSISAFAIDIICSCKDQSARNKWIAIFRRQEGVVIRRDDSGSQVQVTKETP